MDFKYFLNFFLVFPIIFEGLSNGTFGFFQITQEPNFPHDTHTMPCTMPCTITHTITLTIPIRLPLTITSLPFPNHSLRLPLRYLFSHAFFPITSTMPYDYPTIPLTITPHDYLYDYPWGNYFFFFIGKKLRNTKKLLSM